MSLYGWLDPLGLARHDAVVQGQPLTGLWTFETVRVIVAIGFQSFWGQFGWMGVLMDGWVYGLLWAGFLFAVIGAIVAVVDFHRGRIQADSAGSLGLLLLFLLGASIVAGFAWYNLRYFQPQGRYLFAAMPAIALGLVAGLRNIFSDRVGWWMVGLAFAGLAYVDVYAVLRYIEPQLRR